MPDPDTAGARIRRVARRQHGLITRAQLLSAGIGESWIRTQLRRGEIERCGKSVFRFSGSPATFESRAMAACLAHNGCVLSHGSAARIWGLEVPQARQVDLELTLPHDRWNRSTVPTRDVVIHRTRHLDARDCCRSRGLPATTLPRTVIDLAGILPQGATQRLVDDVLARRLTTVPLLVAAVGRSTAPGRRGPAQVRAALEPWIGGPLDSQAEAELGRWLLAAGVPAPVSQLEVTDADGRARRVDFGWPAQRVALEIDGFRWHHNPARFAADRARWTSLRAAGWEVIVTTLTEIRGNPATLLALLTERLRTGDGIC